MTEISGVAFEPPNICCPKLKWQDELFVKSSTNGNACCHRDEYDFICERSLPKPPYL